MRYNVTAMRSRKVKKFIDDHEHLFWYSSAPKSETVSDELLVETLLNYGTLEDIHDLFVAAGLHKVAAVFWGMTGRKKLNYFPEIHNYFDLYFQKHVSGHFKQGAKRAVSADAAF
jgi:hypothetical protein